VCVDCSKNGNQRCLVIVYCEDLEIAEAIILPCSATCFAFGWIIVYHDVEVELLRYRKRLGNYIQQFCVGNC
jgi:hypothetical protein